MLRGVLNQSRVLVGVLALVLFSLVLFSAESQGIMLGKTQLKQDTTTQDLKTQVTILSNEQLQRELERICHQCRKFLVTIINRHNKNIDNSMGNLNELIKGTSVGTHHPDYDEIFSANELRNRANSRYVSFLNFHKKVITFNEKFNNLIKGYGNSLDKTLQAKALEAQGYLTILLDRADVVDNLWSNFWAKLGQYQLV